MIDLTISGTKIVNTVFLGDVEDGRYSNRNGVHTLYVHENIIPGYSPTYHIPFLEIKNNKHVASLEKLKEISVILSDYFDRYERILIHCICGMERSPLALAYWMIDVKMVSNMDEAYEFLQWKRPVVQDRRSLLETQ